MRSGWVMVVPTGKKEASAACSDSHNSSFCAKGNVVAPSVPRLVLLLLLCQCHCHRPCCGTQVDSALLSHPQVAEAVSFAAPDEKYGEVVSHPFSHRIHPKPFIQGLP